MSGERERLCTDFAELRAGTLVMIRDCADCEKPERGMLVALHICDSEEYPEDQGEPGWVMEPRCPMEPECAEDALIGRATVAAGLVYIIDTGLEQETPVSTEAREPVSVR